MEVKSMAEATDNSITRRAVLSGSVALTVTPLMAGNAAAGQTPHPDAALFELERQHRSAARASSLANANVEAAKSAGAKRDVIQSLIGVSDKRVEELGDIEDRICAIPAQTLQGTLVKVRLWWELVCDDDAWRPEDYVAQAIASDVENLAMVQA